MALSSDQINAVNSDSVYHAILVRIVISTSNTIRLTNHYTDLTITETAAGTVTYSSDSELEQLPATKVNTTTNAASSRLRIGIIDQTRRNQFLSADVIGARITVSRVLLDETTNGIIGDPLLRLEGVIWGFDSREDWSQDGTLRDFSAEIDIRPETEDLLTVPNIQTNSRSQQRFAPTDNIFSRVEASANKNVILI